MIYEELHYLLLVSALFTIQKLVRVMLTSLPSFTSNLPRHVFENRNYRGVPVLFALEMPHIDSLNSKEFNYEFLRLKSSHPRLQHPRGF